MGSGLWSSRLTWLLIAIGSIVLSVLFFLPASWLGAVLEKQTQGRLSLGDVQGSFWHGSAFVGVASGAEKPVTPLFAGRFSWQISPLIFLGQLDAQLSNSESLSAPVHVQGSLSEWQVSPAQLALPTERLEGLGAPLNTIGPTGKLSLSWNHLHFSRDNRMLQAAGQLQLHLTEMASRLSPIRPLGSYVMNFDLQGANASLNLMTEKGPMMLSGSGDITNGHFQFSGKAWAQQGQEAKLANLLNLLGQRRKDGDQDIIALEFK
ncbi:type II secretion system protein N [Undibacterium oligocarboniphilum]|uniref:Type II secretion system protein N n=1 Tax=Undibacterium oligocarboniphilum TaxID=666702 RepID=A0A850QND1_9BURK|nr:type II secretion system protein N [Undibacterium oligocarboniphilum]MBC3870219.1 type II secretion system protein N [Undibacterium oligocarboniphilum]NVO78210.1 type II secretion system protein N [Undibacterium oligocarboniphilum]